MPSLHIDFQEGWVADDVVVHVNGEDRHRLSSITTRTQIGLAAQVVDDVRAGEVTIVVDVPRRHISGSHRLVLAGEHWVAVSIVNGALVFDDREQLYGYV